MAFRFQTRKKFDAVLDLEDVFQPMAAMPPTGIAKPSDWTSPASMTEFKILYPQVSFNMLLTDLILISGTLDLGSIILLSQDCNICCPYHVETD